MGRNKYQAKSSASNTSKYPKLPLIAFLPCMLSIIMVVIIQIGGVDPHSEAEENPYLHFPLLSWNYTINPTDRGIKSYSEHVYLNRACITEEPADERVAGVPRCVNIHDKTYSDTTFSNILQKIQSVPRDPKNLKLTQGLYTGSAGLTFFTILLSSTVSSVKPALRKKIRILGVFISLLGFIVTVGASGFLTHQITDLKSQILAFKPKVGVAETDGAGKELQTVYTTNVQDVKLGIAVLGFTWAAVVMILTVVIAWCLSSISKKSIESQESVKLLGRDNIVV